MGLWHQSETGSESKPQTLSQRLMVSPSSHAAIVIKQWKVVSIGKNYQKTILVDPSPSLKKKKEKSPSPTWVYISGSRLFWYKVNVYEKVTTQCNSNENW